MPHAGGANPLVSYLVFPAGPSDAEDLASVHVASWRETYRGLLSDAYLARMSDAAHARRFARSLLHPAPDEMILAAADRRGLVGYAAAGPSRTRQAGEAEIATLYVLRAAQGQGVGGQLIRACARTLQAEGYGSLMISVLRDNLHARGFYEHLGGRPEPPRREPGPGGQLLYEVAYRWADIGVLAS
jgi:ribosomal protein S18 acetylase RimI-like enzyme